MKSLVSLLELLLLDCGSMCAAPVTRDIGTLRARVKHEGESFITITLPAFCKSFERALAQGRVVPGLFSSFATSKAGIPRFLEGFLHRVFGKDGVLVAEPSIASIRAVRQITLFGKKVLRPCSPERVNAAMDKYASCDSEVIGMLPDQLERWVGKVAQLVMENLDLSIEAVRNAMPFHGPGATAEHISGNQKWVFRSWHQRLERVGFTYATHGRISQEITPEDVEKWPTFVEPGAERPSRVVSVPKTLKTPRVIAVEPVVMQYAQQALSKLLVQQLESCWLTRGHLNFRDQTVNQRIALRGSVDGNYATIDMAEASDRVSTAHASCIFQSVPDFRRWLFACRSKRAQLPDGTEVPLRKFASMGSALCFPVEALTFFISIIASRLLRAGRFPSARLVHEYGRDVYVYGDDIIVPADEAAAICSDLEALGFKVNSHKSFWTGLFRESCGKDGYAGQEVTPVYLRRDLPSDRGDVSGLLSGVATGNQLFQAGYLRTATALRKAVERHLGVLPCVPPESPAIGWYHNSEVVPPTRWNPDLQRVEHLCWTTVSPKAPDPLDGDAALAKCLRLVGREFVDPEHLDASPVPYGTALKRRWVALPKAT